MAPDDPRDSGAALLEACKDLQEPQWKMSDDSLRAIFMESSDLIVVVDASSREIIGCNSAAGRYFDCELGGVLGKHFSALFPPEIEQTRAELLDTMRAYGPAIEARELKLPSGRIIPTDMTATPVVWAGKEALMVTFRDVSEREAMLKALREAEERYRIVADFTYDWEYWIDPDGKLIYVSPSCESVTGFSREEFLSSPDLIDRIVHPDDAAVWQAHFRQEISGDTVELDPLDFRITHKDGKARWIAHLCRPVYGADGRRMGRRGSNRDITGRKRAEEEIVRAKDEWERTFNSVPDLIIILDNRRRITRANKAALERLGLTQEDIAGKPCYELFHRNRLPHGSCPHAALLADGKEHTLETPVNGLDGDIFDLRVSPVYDERNNLIAAVHVARDITERKALENERERLIAELTAARDALRFQASHDGLSGLWNRSAILDSLHKELERSRRQGAALSVLMADIDHFKLVNDQFGHLAGDAVLRQVSNMISASVRPYDSVGRYGGEEFLLVLPGCDAQNAGQMAERLRAKISAEPIATAEGAFAITMSFGAASTDGQGETSVDALIRAADEALYRAKNLGRNRVERSV
jgi:diguanylate cyclase (GGDEF)-like protein/PAS domain S-box-containing protein